MLALVVALCAGQVLAVPNPEGPIFSSPALTGSGAFFEFAPASGAGMGTACACTTPTGAKGEALTFTRTGNATCSKQGLATTGIADGDLVVCTANQPRVESSGGVLGLRVEGARTNSVLRSQELDNAAWTLDFAGGGVIPTRTANAATAPDGTPSAERRRAREGRSARVSCHAPTSALRRAQVWASTAFVPTPHLRPMTVYDVGCA